MVTSRFSQLWYRVELLRPRLRSHLKIRRHCYRDQIWYVILDETSGRLHRFTTNAYTLIGLMNGSRTVQELWEKASSRLGDFAPSQDEVITLLGQLHGADLLQCDVPPDVAELFRRAQNQARMEKAQTFLNPLAIRIPLCDPDRFLTRLAPLARPIFGRWGLLCWLLLVGTALVVAGHHWEELTNNILDRVVSPQNLLLVWVLFPFAKLFHELGHGLMAKAWGGEVHDLGIMLLVFTPVPYVDVSSSAAFEKKSRRMAVAAAGMIFELLLAALALAVWVNVEPGLIRNCAYNVMLVAGVSTLLFNSNPLIRYDGYYILSDWIEIPNLAQRARKYVRYLVERYAFGLSDIEPPVESFHEKSWFLFYAPASWVYRLMIIVGIGLFLAHEFLVLGLIVTLWSSLSMLVFPLFRSVKYLMSDPRLRTKRGRALGISALVVAAILWGVFALPIPLRTQVEGVVWLPENSFVRAGVDGFVLSVAVPSGAAVGPDDPLILGEEPTINSEERVVRARVEEFAAQYRAQQYADRVEAEVLKEQLGQEQAKLTRIIERRRELVIRSKTAGRLVIPQEEDLPGKYVKQGETLGYIFPTAKVTVRAVVSQDQANLVRQCTRQVQARFARDLTQVFPVTLVREVPAASEYLPSKTLSVDGGGSTVVDPRETTGTKTFSRIFQYDLQLPLDWSAVNVGDRVYLRFDHGWESLAQRGWRSLRQLFLSRLDV